MFGTGHSADKIRGEHIHHGYYPTPESKANDTKETAQVSLIKLLLEISQLSEPTSGLKVLDVGCGIGGTSRYLASQFGATVTGITISGKQVEIAKRLTHTAATNEGTVPEDNAAFTKLGQGQVQFIELDAEKMGDFFASEASKFDVVWISEALSHFPNKPLFFTNAQKVLKDGGKLVLADWFKSEHVKAGDADIKAIEDGMLLPPLCTNQEYVKMATDTGLKVMESGGPKDISAEVAQTWDITWSLIQNPSLWAFAFSQGRDGIAFLQAFRAMRRGYANGTFRYAVIAFQK